METRKHVLAGILCAFLVIILTSKVEAKSVFAITKHSDSLVQVYDVAGDQIELQLVCDDFPDSYAVDLALSSGSDTLFASYDGSATITMYNAKTMEDEGYINPPGEISGMDFCESDQQLLAIGRDTKDLYVYDYNPETRDLTYNDTIDLANLTSEAFGICLDDHENILYVADNSNIVKYYDASSINFAYLGSIEIEEGGQVYEAVGIDIYNDDQGHKYLYSGAWVHTGIHNSLVRTDLNIADPNDPNYIIVKGVDTSILGVAVDKEAEYSGLVYVTTANGRVAVYDTSDWATDPCASAEPTDHEDVSSPAGLVVGSQYKPSWKIYLDKDDGLDPCDPCSPSCYAPGDEFTYTITYGHGGYNHEWVEVTDFLPRETTFLSSSPQWNDYDPDENSYFWDLGSLTTNDPNNNTITIDVLVNEMAEPNSIIINTAIIETDIAYKVVTVRTPICCWEDPCSVSGVIYVNGMLDPNSTYNTGTSWESAYIDLQSALRRAGVCGAEIWVAMGLYSPGDNVIDSFEIPDNVEVYGGFKGNETTRQQRDFTNYKTILTGYIRETQQGVIRNDKVVTMGDETVLDGFVVQNGKRGVLGDNNDFTISNCVIRDNKEEGLYSDDGDVIVHWCVIKDNDYDGIYSEANNKTLQVSNCKIYENQRNGIYSLYSHPTILNSLIYENGSEDIGYYGVNINQSSGNPIIRNNTIVHNNNEGVHFTGANIPDIRNCIIWYNNESDDLEQLSGFQVTYYSCVTDPNDLTGSSSPDVNGNITCDPCFAYDYPKYGYYHLDPCSHCKDTGDNTNVGQYETDIDTDSRIIDGGGGLIVDMGADEVACEDVSHERDWNADGIVNLHEFSDLSLAWLRDDTDPNWLDTYIKYDFYPDDQIDILDLREFVDDWLWQACWRVSAQGIWMMSSGGGDRSSAALIATNDIVSRAKTEPTLKEQIELAKETIKMLWEIWGDEKVQEAIDEKQWLELMIYMYDYLNDLETRQ